MEYIYIGISIIIAIIFHEMAHGYMSYWLGDSTAKQAGRLSINPLNHLDPVGTICLFLFHFGWAKPVPIDSSYYKNEKLGVCLVAMAGPLMNFILALISTLLLNITNSVYIISFLQCFIGINVGLMTFNLIPIPPLDGSKILAIVLPHNIYEKVLGVQQYSVFFLMLILYTGILNPVLSYLQNGVLNILSLFIF